MKNNDLQKYFTTDCHELFNLIKKFDWRIERSSEISAIAYFLQDSDSAEKKLQLSLEKYKPKLLILNKIPKIFSLEVPFVICLDGQWADMCLALCDKFFPIKEKMKYIGITGTNGKTTTTDLALQMCAMSGISAISVGTLGVRKNGETIEEFGLTTPGLIQLRSIISKHSATVDVVIMEVSSHALDQKRIAGINLDAASWVSFSQDHLDYHGGMDEYFLAKKKIIKYLKPEAKIFIPQSQVKIYNELSAESSLSIIPAMDESIRQRLPVFFQTKFNQDNLSCAIAVAKAVGVDEIKIKIDQLKPPPGRYYVKEWNGKMAIVDFAHTPDAIKNILEGIKLSYPDKKIKVLFGCGGDRDKSKRSLMGSICEKYSDQQIITSDNPRTEDPSQIITDIMKGIKNNKNTKIILDRKTAVAESLRGLQINEVLLIAGKGHENYIIIGNDKIPYSDIDELNNFIKTNKV